MTGPAPLRPEVPQYNTGDNIIKLDTSPNVFGRSVLRCVNTVPVTIIRFDNGSPYQIIKVLGEGQTTVQNNAVIKTNTGANKLLASNRIYTFTYVSGVWYEDE